jgi:hypothetical protein
VTQFPVNEIRKLEACLIELLGLVDAHLNDSDLEDFAKWAEFSQLTLNDNTGITDVGLEHLEKIVSLNFLDLVRTSVTKEGIEEFQKKRPDVAVSF